MKQTTENKEPAADLKVVAGFEAETPETTTELKNKQTT